MSREKDKADESIRPFEPQKPLKPVDPAAQKAEARRRMIQEAIVEHWETLEELAKR